MKLFRVGGAVRDRLLNLPVTDVDWVVVGASPSDMLDAGYRQVGADFPVFLHPDTHEEYALARTERKLGHGYHGFTVFAGPEVTLEQDLLRRDLTINAMAEAPDGHIIDPHGGQRDLAARVLRHVSPAFAEDPLRVLRVARFAARFAPLGFTLAPETLAFMRDIVTSGELAHLVAERVWQETQRALHEARPDIYIDTLRRCGALAVVMPEVDALFGVPQPPAHHPEIDTGAHVLLCLQQAAQRHASLATRFAVLMHDLGKGLTPKADWPRHIAHEDRGTRLVQVACDRLKAPNDCRDLALLCCKYHTHAHRALELRPDTVLTLLENLDALRRPERFEEWLLACECDARGRTGLENRDYPQADYLRSAFNEIRAVDPKALVALGLTGKAMGEGLRRERLARLKQLKKNHQKSMANED